MTKATANKAEEVLPNILTLKGRGFDTTTYSLIYGFALFMVGLPDPMAAD
jgi:hypothetical protein